MKQGYQKVEVSKKIPSLFGSEMMDIPVGRIHSFIALSHEEVCPVDMGSLSVGTNTCARVDQPLLLGMVIPPLI